eukprot:Trichotokara_eunicae@DN4791_c0_g1_i2.p2
MERKLAAKNILAVVEEEENDASGIGKWDDEKENKIKGNKTKDKMIKENKEDATPKPLPSLFHKEEKQESSNQIFIKNISFETSDASLNEILSKLDGFRSCRIMKKKRGKQELSMGYGFAEFNTVKL